MIEILEPWIARTSSVVISSPLLSSSSIKALIPAFVNASWRWPVKFLRVSSPLKLMNTSWSEPFEKEDKDGEAEEDDEDEMEGEEVEEAEEDEEDEDEAEEDDEDEGEEEEDDEILSGTEIFIWRKTRPREQRRKMRTSKTRPELRLSIVVGQ